MVFEGLFDFIDNVFTQVGEAFEKGWLYGAVLVGFFLLIMTFIIILVLIFTSGSDNTVQIPQEKQDIINNAVGYCNKKGFNSWEWINETSYTFGCINKEQKNNSIEKYHVTG